MNDITTYDSSGRITSSMRLYEGADFEFYSQGNQYIFGYFDAKEYYISDGIAIKFPEQPKNTIWDWSKKQWVKDAETCKHEIKSKRNDLLIQSDWTQLPDVPLNTKTQWATYRQELRDITSQPGYPFDVIWPTKPE